MIQILSVLLAVILGLLYNYFFRGFHFVPAVCFFAGLFMIMPTLFNFKVADFTLVKVNKMIVMKNIVANFILLPAAAVSIGLLTGDFGIAAGLFLLSVLASGGMVMHWIKRSKGDTKMGFILLFTNLILLSLSFYMFDQFSLYFAEIYEMEEILFQPPSEVELRGAFVVLIVIPFLVSRLLLRFLPSLVAFIEKNRQQISNSSIFLIIFFLFALESSKVLFEIESVLFFKAFAATLAFYGIAFAVGKMLFDTKDPTGRAAFWHIITRYITLALIMSTFTVDIYGVTLILPIMIAYFIQLPLAIIYDHYASRHHKA